LFKTRAAVVRDRSTSRLLDTRRYDSRASSTSHHRYGVRHGRSPCKPATSRHAAASAVTTGEEPAVLSRAARLQELLGLSDDELLAALDADPLELISGELDHKPELPILLDLLADHDDSGLRRWVRTAGPSGRPLDLLLARDFAGFENALATLSEIGFVIRRRR
jgi:hypothetical protein